MPVIALSEQNQWFAARWAYRWFLHCVKDELPAEHVCRAVLDQAIALDGLHLHLESTENAEPIRKAAMRVARNIENGEGRRVAVEGRVLDDGSQKEYCTAISDLLARLEEHGGA